jgi:hypothetical protein
MAGTFHKPLEIGYIAEPIILRELNKTGFMGIKARFSLRENGLRAVRT